MAYWLEQAEAEMGTQHDRAGHLHLVTEGDEATFWGIPR